MNTPQFNVTLQGSSIADIINGAKNLLNTLEASQEPQSSAPALKNSKGKKAPAPQVEEPELEMSDEAEEASEDASLDFMSDEVEAVEEVAPKKSAKANGQAKLTKDDVNDACLAYAREHDRKATLKVLAKFGVKSVTELEEKQFAAVIKALKI